MRVSELHHCQCQHRLSFFSLLLTAKSPFKRRLPGNPPSKRSFRQEPITQPLRSKISPTPPESAHSVYICWKFKLPAEHSIYCCIDIFHCLRDIKWGENKVQMQSRQGIWHPWRKVQTSPILYPERGCRVWSSLSGSHSKGRSLRNWGELWHSPLPRVRAKARA